MNLAESALLTIWEPNFLEKDYFWFEFAKKLAQVSCVSPSAFNVEGYQG